MSISVKAYVKQYYSGKYRYGVSDGTREEQSQRKLTEADMHAVKSALRDLQDYDYEDGDGEDLTKKVQAFVETYNHLVDSVGSLENEDTDQLLKKMKKLTRDQKGKLEDIGISIQSDGKLKVDKDKLGKSSRNMVHKLFGQDKDYSAGIETYMKKTANVIRLQDLGYPKQDQQLYDSIQQTLQNGSVNLSL